MFGCSFIGGAAVTAMLAVLALAGDDAAPRDSIAVRTSSLPHLAPWKPSPGVRFAGALTSLDQHVLDSHDRMGYVTASVPGVSVSQLAELRADAAQAAERVARTCRCSLRGYRVVIEVPGRAPVVLASGAL